MSAGADTGEEEAGSRTNVFGEAPVASVQLNLTALMDILSNLLFFLLAAFGATIVMVINGTVPVQSADESGVADTKRAVTVNVSVQKEGFQISALGTAFTQEELDGMGRTIPLHGKTHDFAVTDHASQGYQAKISQVGHRHPDTRIWRSSMRYSCAPWTRLANTNPKKEWPCAPGRALSNRCGFHPGEVTWPSANVVYLVASAAAVARHRPSRSISPRSWTFCRICCSFCLRPMRPRPPKSRTRPRCVCRRPPAKCGCNSNSRFRSPSTQFKSPTRP
jgi:biopolymer transport protein ExbD